MIQAHKLNRKWLSRVAALCFVPLLAHSALPATKKLAVVTSAGSKLADIPLGDLSNLCKGVRKAWPDGKNFELVIKDPESPEMRSALQLLFGSSSDIKSVIAKLNETRRVVYVVDSEDELMRTVDSLPGAVGILDVYSINDSVKVLRIDGKLPFDVGYALKGSN